jgi:putative thiamine transport system ATP-binding protein
MNGDLRLEGVSLEVAGRSLLHEFDLTVRAGEIVTLMGPSGIGKSALVAFIGGHLDQAFVARGRVLLGGRDIGGLPPEKRHIGLLFQDDLLFPHLSVAGNLAFGLTHGRRGKRERRALIEETLAQAGLAGFGTRDPATLSGGQRARVALLRTLLSEPRALLLDEPFGQLDAALRAEIRSYVFSQIAALGLPALLVTHDRADAIAAGGIVLELGLSSSP